MENKKTKPLFAAIFVIVAIATFLIIASSTFSMDAFANNESTAESITNEATNVSSEPSTNDVGDLSFYATPDPICQNFYTVEDSGALPGFDHYLAKGYKYQFYAVLNIWYPEADGRYEVNLEYKTALCEDYEFIGFFYKGNEINELSVTEVYDDSPIEIRFEKTSHEISLYIDDEDGHGVDNYNIEVYDKNKNLIHQDTTTSSGGCFIENVTADKYCDGYILGYKDGLTNFRAALSKFEFGYSKEISINTIVYDISQENYSFRTSSTSHDSFLIHGVSEFEESEITTNIYCKNVDDFYGDRILGKWQITEDGSIYKEFAYGPYYGPEKETISAISNDGCDLDYWLVDYGQNEVIEFRPGDDPIEITNSPAHIFFEPVYKSKPTPDPDPEPEPTPAEATSAQTGDNSLPIVAFAFIAIISAGVIITMKTNSYLKSKH